jgi:hypothetical protein
VICLVVAGAAAQEALTNEAILKLVQAGISEDLVVKLIHSRAGKYSLDADQVISLKNAGLSDRIVRAMIERSGSEAPTATKTAAHDPGLTIRHERNASGEYTLLVTNESQVDITGFRIEYSCGSDPRPVYQIQMFDAVAKQHQSIGSGDSYPIVIPKIPPEASCKVHQQAAVFSDGRVSGYEPAYTDILKSRKTLHSALVSTIQFLEGVRTDRKTSLKSLRQEFLRQKKAYDEDLMGYSPVVATKALLIIEEGLKKRTAAADVISELLQALRPWQERLAANPPVRAVSGER